MKIKIQIKMESLEKINEFVFSSIQFCFMLLRLHHLFKSTITKYYNIYFFSLQLCHRRS